MIEKKRRRSPFREVNVAVDRELHLIALQSDVVTKVTGLAVNLDPLLQIFFLKKSRLLIYHYTISYNLFQARDNKCTKKLSIVASTRM